MSTLNVAQTPPLVLCSKSPRLGNQKELGHSAVISELEGLTKT